MIIGKTMIVHTAKSTSDRLVRTRSPRPLAHYRRERLRDASDRTDGLSDRTDRLGDKDRSVGRQDRSATASAIARPHPRPSRWIDPRSCAPSRTARPTRRSPFLAPTSASPPERVPSLIHNHCFSQHLHCKIDAFSQQAHLSNQIFLTHHQNPPSGAGPTPNIDTLAIALWRRPGVVVARAADRKWIVRVDGRDDGFARHEIALI